VSGVPDADAAALKAGEVAASRDVPSGRAPEPAGGRANAV